MSQLRHPLWNLFEVRAYFNRLPRVRSLRLRPWALSVQRFQR
jgi:hypothetical protein